MTRRLNKVTVELNVGLKTIVEFLRKKGFTIEENMNAKIPDDAYELLIKEYSPDQDLRKQTEQFMQQRQNKDRNVSVSIDGFKKEKKEPTKEENMIKTEIPQEVRPHFVSVGKIDLDNLKGSSSKPAHQEETKKTDDIKPVVEKPIEEKPVASPVKEEIKAEIPPVKVAKVEPVLEERHAPMIEQPAIKAEQPAPQKEEVIATKIEKTAEPVAEVVKPAAPKVEIKKEEVKVEKVEVTASEQPIAKPAPADVKAKEENTSSVAAPAKVFTLNTEKGKPKLNIVGQIDLDALNQSTRPKKKTKEEKRKEREEKEKIRQDQKKQMREAIIKEIRKDDSKGPKYGSNNNQPNGGNNNGNNNNGNNNNRKKRNRINNEKVDINKVSSNASNGSNDNRGYRNNNNNNNNNQQRNQDSGRRNRDRYKKSPVKEEINEEDVAKQVKETLARLTNKGKTKASKYRKEKREQASNRQQEIEDEEIKESKIIKLTEFVTANELATMMNVGVNEVISTCMSIGIMVSINQRLDAETINLVAEEFGFKTEYVSAEVAQAVVEEEDAESDLKPRAPIVTVMGHVDHGKTSLLDYIRKANVIAGEAGGITQHIGAYNVKLENGRHITFLDTPGHEAFTAMRARGAKVTDIAIIIIAADDHIMPQTKEAINHAMAANVPIVFAINKIDKPGANPEKIKEELANMNFLVEEWGGKYQSQDISAKKGIGVKELMEKVLLEADILELKANPNRHATGSIIESSLDKGRGYVATVLVSNGTLKVGDIVLAGTSFGRVKAMFNERNQRIKQAAPAEPALILGLNGAPQAGDTFHVIDTDQEARELANKREQLQREQGLRTQKILTLDELGRRIALGNFRELNIIIKGDVDGSIEALKDSLIKLSTEQIQVNVIHAAVGQISESDVTLAAASDAIIVGFQVRPSAAARKYAEQEGVDIRLYSVIYDAIEEVKDAMEGMLAPQVKEVVTSSIEVRQVFHITKVGTVAGAMVKEGKVKRSDKARVVRDGIVIFNGAINALKRFKDDVKEVNVNFECGISLVNYNDLRPGDIIETYEEVEVKQTL
jgi:translation initiation factor IF-2